MGCAFFNIGQQLTLIGFCERRPGIYVIPKILHTASFLWIVALRGANAGIQGVAGAMCGSSLIYLLAIIAANAWLKREREWNEAKFVSSEHSL